MVFSFYDESGKRKQRSESTGLKERGNKRAAEAMMKRRLEELENLSKPQVESYDALFLEAMEEWLNVVMPTQVRANTLDEYKRAFAHHIKAHIPFQKLPLRKLTPQLLQSFYNEGVKKGLSPNTIHKQHTNINKFLICTWILQKRLWCSRTYGNPKSIDWSSIARCICNLDIVLAMCGSIDDHD